MKSNTYIVFVILVIASYHSSAQVSINSFGNSADSSAILDVQSTNKGFLAPRMTNTQIDSILNPAEGLIVYNSDAHKPVFFNGTEWLFFDGKKMLYIGKYYEDGVIFYIDSTGEHGLLCATSDSTIWDGGGGNPILIYTTWSGAGLSFVGGTETGIGTGLSNTILLVNEYAPFDCAAMWCYEASDPNHPWFLPSRDELVEMYQNRELIDATSIAYGGTAFRPEDYWSSSEFAGGQAWIVAFSNGSVAEQFITIELYARSIRSF